MKALILYRNDFREGDFFTFNYLLKRLDIPEPEWENIKGIKININDFVLFTKTKK